MFIIVLGIIILVYCSKYKKNPLMPTLSALKTFTIIHTIFLCFGAISLFSSIMMFATGTFFEYIQNIFLLVFREIEIDTDFVIEMMGDINSFVYTAIWTGLIIDIAIMIFGIIALIFGIRTFSDKSLAATAAANTEAENKRRQAIFAQNMRNYQQGQYNQGYYQQGQYNQGYYQQGQYNQGYYQQNPNYQNNGGYYNQQPQNNSFTTQTAQNPAWICNSCGTSNIAAANFCSKCGAKH